MRFADPLFFIIALVLPYMAFQYFTKDREGHIRFPVAARLKKLAPSKTLFFRHSLIVFRCLAVFMLVLVLMRPQSGNTTTEILSEGVDIVLAIDVSGSMRAMDFEMKGERVTRLQVVKNVVMEFIENRKADRIGMVVFGAEAFTQSPLTLDHGISLYFLDRLEIGMAGDSTAVGSAIGTAVKRLKDIESKTKLIILLTDGRNNAGNLSPEMAAEIAKTHNIKIYTIGAGTQGEAPFPVDTPFGKRLIYQRVDLDETTLQKIAETTGGKYFRATDTESLKEIYGQINAMEKTEVKVKEYTEYTELFPWFLTPAIFFLLLEIVMGQTWFRKIP
jgi:Ca-activated chloride channel family protein